MHIYFSKGTLRSYCVFLMPWTGGDFHAVHFLDACRWLTWRKGVLFHFNYVIILYPSPRLRLQGEESWQARKRKRNKKVWKVRQPPLVKYRAFKARERFFPSCCPLGASKQQVSVKVPIAPVQGARDRIKMRLTSRSRGGAEEVRERLCKMPSHYCPCLQVMWKTWKNQSEPVENLPLVSVGFRSDQWCSPDNPYFLHPSLLAGLFDPFLVNSKRVFLVAYRNRVRKASATLSRERSITLSCPCMTAPVQRHRGKPTVYFVAAQVLLD